MHLTSHAWIDESTKCGMHVDRDQTEKTRGDRYEEIATARAVTYAAADYMHDPVKKIC